MKGKINCWKIYDIEESFYRYATVIKCFFLHLMRIQVNSTGNSIKLRYKDWIDVAIIMHVDWLYQYSCCFEEIFKLRGRLEIFITLIIFIGREDLCFNIWRCANKKQYFKGSRFSGGYLKRKMSFQFYPLFVLMSIKWARRFQKRKICLLSVPK